MDNSAAKIFLEDQRGLSEIEGFRSYHLFNFGDYQHEHKNPFGNLYLLNDDTLAAGKSITMTVETNSHCIFLPIVGAVAYKDSLGNDQLIQTGEVFICQIPALTNYKLFNPYESELINFLQIWIKADANLSSNFSELIAFSFNEQASELINISSKAIVEQTPFQLSIGKLAGRADKNYHLKNTQQALFVFAIEGAFEVQGRLMHPRDGLALWNIQEIDLEALSNDAIILLLEFDL
jgi:quercetin 2,3-dioxygenase